MKTIEIAVPLKYLNNFWRSLEMPLISYKLKISLTWSEKCILPNAYHLVHVYYLVAQMKQE